MAADTGARPSRAGRIGLKSEPVPPTITGSKPIQARNPRAVTTYGYARCDTSSEHLPPMGTILLIILILLLLGALPTWPHSRSWGYGPSGGLGLIVVIIIILVLTHHL